MSPNFYQDNFDDFLGTDCLKLGQETWRLFVDGRQQKDPLEKGWVAFELREPGCLHGIFQALAAQRENIHEDISLDRICVIHKKCTEATERLQRSNQPGVLRSSADVVFFGLTDYPLVDEAVCGYDTPSAIQISAREQWTREVEAEINKVLSREKPLFLFKYNKNSIVPGIYSKITRVIPNIAGAELKRAAEHFINKYNTNMHQIIIDDLEDKKEYENQSSLNNSNMSDAGLDEIINLVTVLERLHIFSDANGRTLCTVLLNRELIKYGYSPVILDNPNMFDGCCHETIKAKIKEGMLRFKEIKEGKIPENYIKTTDVMDDYSAEKARHYYYDPLKVLTTDMAWVRKLNQYISYAKYTNASTIIDKLLQPSVVPPENGDINIEVIDFQRSMLKHTFNTERLDPNNKNEFLQKASTETKELFFYLRRYDALEKRMQEAQQASLTSSSLKPSKVKKE